MKTEGKFTIDKEVDAARNADTGVWYISHLGVGGRRIPWYSTGIKGSKEHIREYIRASGVLDMVKAAKSDDLQGIALAKILSGGKKMRCGEVLNEWERWMQKYRGRSNNTLIQYRRVLEAWMRDNDLVDRDPNNVTPDHVFNFVNPQESPIKKSTREQRLNAIKSFFAYCTANRISLSDPSACLAVRGDFMRHEQKRKRKVEAYTDAEVQQLLDYLFSAWEDHLYRSENSDVKGQTKVIRRRAQESKAEWARFWYCAVLLSYSTGLRLSDICNLEWDCFADPDELVVFSKKTGTRLIVPLSEEAIAKAPTDAMRAAMRRTAKAVQEVIPMLEVQHPKDVFPKWKSILNTPRQNGNLSCAFKRQLENAGLPKGKTFHGLRHTRIRQLKADGVDLEQIAEMVGHKSTSTTQGYLG